MPRLYPGKCISSFCYTKNTAQRFLGQELNLFIECQAQEHRKKLYTIAGDRNEANYLAYLSLFRPVWYPIDAKGIQGQQSQFSVSTYSATL